MLSKDNEIDNWRQRLLLDEAEFSAPGKAASIFEQIVEQTVNQRNKKKRFKVVQLVAASIVAVLGLSVLISQFWKDAQLQHSNNEQVKFKLETPKLLQHELNDMIISFNSCCKSLGVSNLNLTCSLFECCS